MTAEYSRLPIEVQKVFMRLLARLENYGIAMADSTVLLELNQREGDIIGDYWSEFRACVAEQTEKWEAMHLGLRSESENAGYLLIFETRWKYRVQKILKNFLETRNEESMDRRSKRAWA